MWPDRRLIELFKIEFPIVQAPVAGAMDWELAAAAAEAGALGSLPTETLLPSRFPLFPLSSIGHLLQLGQPKIRLRPSRRVACHPAPFCRVPLSQYFRA
jgi:NAD(P)H-dependent flavin oxidoreductase YrpB (nitropropane dioxygenase family)